MTKLDLLLIKFTDNLKISGFSERSIPDYTRNVQYFLDYLRNLKIENIAEADRRIIADYQTKVYLTTYRGKPLAPGTRQFRITALKTFYRYLLKTGIILYDPTDNLEMPKTPDTLPKNILNKKEIGDLLAAPDLNTPLGLRDRAMLELFYSTGIRASELCSLKLDDLDLNHDELRIDRGKNQKSRLVPIGEKAHDFLETYLYEARPKLATPGNVSLFVTKRGKKFTRTSLFKLFARHSQTAGLKTKTTPHALRHTCATHLLKGKADIRRIQELLGHKSIATTQRYTKVEITDLKKILKRCHPRERKEIETNEL